MTGPRAALADNGNAPGRRVHFRCPGCQKAHGVVIDVPEGWTWNGDLERPTFTPSVLVHSHQTFVDHDLEGDALTAPENLTMTPQCHSFVVAGRIQFLADSTHELAGQTVDLPEWSS